MKARKMLDAPGFKVSANGKTRDYKPSWSRLLTLGYWLRVGRIHGYRYTRTSTESCARDQAG